MRSPPLEPDAVARELVTPRVPSSWPAHGLGSCRVLASQLPPVERWPSGAWIGVTSGDRQPGFFGRLLGGERQPKVHLAARCMALSLAGYRDICAADGIAFGRVP